ncbi:hypothetical protein CC2G_013614 [Coprinopsis cinerea AmutBmut pab1-1]|nr:hypothetical protein CC2G_013614 [Coprinopsis cinerea AmutBmut pab1-1]
MTQASISINVRLRFVDHFDTSNLFSLLIDHRCLHFKEEFLQATSGLAFGHQIMLPGKFAGVPKGLDLQQTAFTGLAGFKGPCSLTFTTNSPALHLCFLFSTFNPNFLGSLGS